MTDMPCNVSDLFPKYDQIIFLDVETTGLSIDENQIIELAAVRHLKADDSALAMPSSFYTKSPGEIDLLIQLPDGALLPPEIVELTHITDEMLAADGISESDAVAAFLKLFLPAEKTLIIAHNAQFDLSFILKMLEKHNRHIPVVFDVLDTFTVLKDRKAYPHALKDAIDYYQISGVENSHRACDDVAALCEVVKQMKNERDDLEDYINLIGVHRVHGLWGEQIGGVTYGIQMLGSKRKRLPDFINEGKRIYDPHKIKETRPLIFKDGESENVSKQNNFDKE